MSLQLGSFTFHWTSSHLKESKTVVATSFLPEAESQVPHPGYTRPTDSPSNSEANSHFIPTLEAQPIKLADAHGVYANFQSGYTETLATRLHAQLHTRKKVGKGARTQRSPRRSGGRGRLACRAARGRTPRCTCPGPSPSPPPSPPAQQPPHHSRSAEAASANSVQANTSPGSSANKGTNRAGPARATHPREVLGDERGGEDAARRRHWGGGEGVGLGLGWLNWVLGQSSVKGLGGLWREGAGAGGRGARGVRAPVPSSFCAAAAAQTCPPADSGRLAYLYLAVPRRRLV